MEDRAEIRRSAGPFGAFSGRSSATRFRNHDGDPAQPTRSAITVAGIVENSASSARTRGSNSSNTDGLGGCLYDGSSGEASALAIAFRDSPGCLAICAFGTPSAKCNCRIKAQCSKVIIRLIWIRCSRTFLLNS